MTLRHGRELLAMPGPTTVPDAVLAAMHRPAIDIYAGELLDTTERCHANLRTVFQTQHHVYIYAANGHGAWEAAVSNVLSRDDKVLVLESGRFALGWGALGEVAGLDVEILPQDFRRAVDPDVVEARLLEDGGHQIKAVLVVQVDTASGVYNDIAAIRAALDNCDHPALLMVDTIASLGTMPFKMDDWRVDVAVCGSQKGLMTPPGLSFCAAGERAVVAHASANLRTRYWDWTERQGAEHYQKYCGTPPEHMLFALDKALSILLDEGLDEAFERHRLLAGAVQTAVAAWSAGGALEFNVTTPSERAGSVTTIKMCDEWKSKLISDFTRDICGVTLGLGIGGLNGFRIAHMGHINAPMILGALASVELALHTLNYPCPRSGTAEATQFLSRQLQAG
jgi:alanine-glyoxylate transaminase / serine-glyoxylate transaminase / serine-pyruvate transaminase